MKKPRQEAIGEFTVVSGKVYVTDPCYEKGGRYQALVKNVKNGKWFAFIERGDEDRPAILKVVHEDYDITRAENPFDVPSVLTSPEKVEIGVDSGQAGVFDTKFYRDDSSVVGLDRKANEAICEDEPFYSMCRSRTLSWIGAGTIPYGAVSSSGYGDGCYDAFVFKDAKGKVIDIRIIFIGDDNEDCENEE